MSLSCAGVNAVLPCASVSALVSCSGRSSGRVPLSGCADHGSCGCNANQNIVFTNEHRRETSHKVHVSLLWETFGGGRHLQFLKVYDYLSCINTAVNFNRPPGHDSSMSCGGNIRNSGLLHKRPWRETEGSQSNFPPRDHRSKARRNPKCPKTKTPADFCGSDGLSFLGTLF